MLSLKNARPIRFRPIRPQTKPSFEKKSKDCLPIRKVVLQIELFVWVPEDLQDHPLEIQVVEEPNEL